RARPPEPVVPIPPGEDLEQEDNERAVPTPGSDPTPHSAASLDPGLDRRVRELGTCRASMAAARRTSRTPVEAGQVLVRGWWRREGAVENVEAGALRATDPEVLSCVKRRVGAWTLPPSDRPWPVSFEEIIEFLAPTGPKGDRAPGPP